MRALRDADRRKDEFLATLAHELRNALAPMRSALHSLDRERSHAAGFDRHLVKPIDIATLESLLQE